jgi:ABC-2 type transport system ATP-binding protein
MSVIHGPLTGRLVRGRHLRFHRGARCILDGIDLDLAPGEALALVGRNGAGKTTTMHLVLGFLTPHGGELEVCGHPMPARAREARGLLAHVPENVRLYPEFSARENLRYFLGLGGRDPGPREADGWLDRVGFPARALDDRLGTFSKGMRQKVGLAIAVAREARLILLDEPFSGLDPASARDLVHLLSELKSEGRGLLLNTHEILRTHPLLDRIAVLGGGKIQEVLEVASHAPDTLETRVIGWLEQDGRPA